MDLKKAITKSATHIEIVKFFMENPASVDTSRGIGAWIKKDISIVKKALEDLEKAGILEGHKVSSIHGYGLCRNSRTIFKIKKILKSK